MNILRGLGRWLGGLGGTARASADAPERISILIPNHNKGQYIAEAIGSIISQNCDRWDIYVVDDGSTDNSREVLKRYADHPRISVFFNEENRGVAFTTHRLIGLSENDIVGILDSDDILHRRCLQRVLKYYGDCPSAEFVYTNFWYCTERLKRLRRGYAQEIPTGQTNLENDYATAFRTFRKSAYARTDGIDMTLTSAVDKDLIYRMEEVTHLHFINRPLYFFRMLPQSLSRGENKNLAERQHELVKEKARQRRAQAGNPSASCSEGVHYGAGPSSGLPETRNRGDMTQDKNRTSGIRGLSAGKLLVILASLSVLVLLALGILKGGGFLVASCAVMGVGGLGLLQFFAFAGLLRRIDRTQDHFTRLLKQTSLDEFHQVEALFSLYNTLDIRHPLPPMRGWAISPDFASLLIRVIQQRRPELIVEASCGVSTLIAAYALRSLGTGRIVSLEHSESHVLETRRHIEHHGLGDIASVIHAPLTKHTIENEVWLWYDLACIADVVAGGLEMLVIDGPPMDVQPLARFPALPLLMDRFDKSVVVLLDDAARDEEKRTVARWLELFEEFEHEYLISEKGASILRRKGV